MPSRSSRRRFLQSAGLTLGAIGAARMGFGAAVRAKDDGKSKMTAAIIGHTGRGDYGHGLDQVFNNRENIEVVAIADPVSSGRTAASLRTKAVREYPDYRQMLEREKPRLVSIAPRWTDQHHAMAMAALEIGAHVLMEKPIAQTLAEADEILGKANKSGLKIAVAHQMRLAPNILHLKRRIDQGLLGDLLQIRAYGKQDSRAGGEDMLVLGTHLFDLMRFFGGNASWCSAQVLQNGHEITLLDAHTAKEDIGPIAGNEIEAQFGLEGNVSGSFTSRAKLREQIAHWGLELIGSKSTARILADISPMTFILRAGAWTASGKSDRWERLEDDPTLNATVGETSTELANKRVVDDWLDSIERNREPVCSGRSAMKALEMVMAVYHAGLSRQRVKLPLANRTHPLTVLK